MSYFARDMRRMIVRFVVYVIVGALVVFAVFVYYRATLLAQ